MSWSIYNVSKANTVVSFRQNQKEPNKVGGELVEMMRNLVRDGAPFEEAYAALKERYTEYKEKNIRGIDSVGLRGYNDIPTSVEQAHQSIYLSYKLNGTFATFTEYLPLNKVTEHD